MNIYSGSDFYNKMIQNSNIFSGHVVLFHTLSKYNQNHHIYSHIATKNLIFQEIF